MKRVLAAAVLIPTVSYAIFSDHLWIFLAVLISISLLCYHEFQGIIAAHRIHAGGPLGYGAGLLVLMVPGQELVILTLTALLALSLAARATDLASVLPRAGALVLGVVYIFGSFRCAFSLRSIHPHWLLFAALINWAGDIAAYYVGRGIGKHKFAPSISPAKTWEGAVASLVAALLVGGLYLHQFRPEVGVPEALLLAAVGNAAGQIGDLAESALKRGAGVKDSGRLLPGHGGWLDRLDSCLFAFPVVYFFLSRPWQIWL